MSSVDHLALLVDEENIGKSQCSLIHSAGGNCQLKRLLCRYNTVISTGARRPSAAVKILSDLTDEMQKLISTVCLRERVLLFLDMVTGLRRGELAGLKWQDIDFLNLQLNVNRSVVHQHVGRCKTEISQKPVPIDEYTAADLLEWYQETPFRAPSDWVFGFMASVGVFVVGAAGLSQQLAIDAKPAADAFVKHRIEYRHTQMSLTHTARSREQ
jgi:integrase